MEKGVLDLAGEAFELTSAMPGGRLSEAAQVDLLARGGSDRYFFRLRDSQRSAVALIQPGGGEEFYSYLEIGSFLRENEIGVPQFYASDNARGILVMEDLGTMHLDELLKGSTAAEELSFYRECMEILLMVQTSVTSEMERRGLLATRTFDEKTLLGETDYFAAEFIDKYCPVGIPAGWEEERREIARRMSSVRRSFMHRDFQSRNIIVKDGRPRIIDFQAAHRGPGIYDVASLLKDPYHPISHGTRKTLIMEFYYRLSEAGAAGAASFDEYYDCFLMAGVQRNLQALAAFVRLGLGKGKKDFLDSIPAGLDLLEEGIDEIGRFPAMKKLVESIRIELRGRT